jgi:predicted ester cyclase
MSDLQDAKAVVRAYQASVDSAAPDAVASALAAHTGPDYLWRGMHPFDIRNGASEVAEIFWSPLKIALTSLTRREDIFMAGRNQMDDFQSIWVVSMGHLVGLHDAPWLGIPPTRKMAFLRYAEFSKVENGKITETALFCDIPHLMVQAGVNPFPPQTAAHLVQPGPETHTGRMDAAQDPAEGEKTLAVINAMINDLGTWQSGLPLVEELARTWNKDMIWWGPAGIGATYTIARYAEQHAGPFRASFINRTGTGHLCRLAEGEFGGFFGWPNFTAIATGGFMGLPATGKTGEFRIIDVYRRGGEKLSENWVFIDLLHWLKGQGLDVLGRLNAHR